MDTTRAATVTQWWGGDVRDRSDGEEGRLLSALAAGDRERARWARSGGGAGGAGADGGEGRLLSALGAGDREAAERLVERTYRGVFAPLRRRCGERHPAPPPPRGAQPP